MGVFFGEVTLETVKGRASYHDISDEIRENIKKSELKNGCVVISSAHTTCSLYFDECMHDTNYWGVEQLEESTMEPFVEEVCGFASGKTIGLFGSYGWGDGEWMRNWVEQMEGAGATVVGGEDAICQEAPDEDAQDELKAMGKQLAAI